MICKETISSGSMIDVSKGYYSKIEHRLVHVSKGAVKTDKQVNLGVEEASRFK